MLGKIKQKVKSGYFFQRFAVSFFTGVVFFVLTLVQIFLLFFRNSDHLGDYILLIIVDVILTIAFLIAGIADKKHSLSNKENKN